MKRFLLFILMLSAAFRAEAQFSEDVRTIEIGLLSTTHLIFTTDITYVDVSMESWVAWKPVPASRNVLALKAKSEFSETTTVSVLEANGSIHTFQVKFNPYPAELLVDTRLSERNTSGTVNTQERPGSGSVPSSSGREVSAVPSPADLTIGNMVPVVAQHEPVGGMNVTSSQSSNFAKSDAPTLQEIMSRPQEVFHIGAKNFRIEAYCTNIFVYSDFIYIVIAVENGSDIGYEAGDAQFSIETQTRKKKFLESEKDVWAKSSYGTLSCAPRGRTLVGYTIPKFTLLKNEALRIYIYEKKGSRNLVLTLKDKDINYAVSPFGS